MTIAPYSPEQLAGVFGQASEALALYLKSWDKNQWSAASLNTENIHDIVCDHVGSDMSNRGLGNFTNLIENVEELPNNELQYSMKETMGNWQTLCNTLNPNRLMYFFSRNTTTGTVCDLAGQDSPAPNVNVGNDNIDATLMHSIHKAAANFLAWQIVDFFTATLQVQTLCNNFNDQLKNNTLVLDLTTGQFRRIVCEYKTKPPPTIHQVQTKQAGFLAKRFSSTIWAVSNIEQFRQPLSNGYVANELEHFKDFSTSGSARVLATIETFGLHRIAGVVA